MYIFQKCFHECFMKISSKDLSLYSDKTTVVNIDAEIIWSRKENDRVLIRKTRRGYDILERKNES